jgi:hypothetical protein
MSLSKTTEEIKKFSVMLRLKVGTERTETDKNLIKLTDLVVELSRRVDKLEE